MERRIVKSDIRKRLLNTTQNYSVLILVMNFLFTQQLFEDGEINWRALLEELSVELKIFLDEKYV